MNVAEALRQGRARLAEAGIENPALDARLLLGLAMGVDQAALLREQGAVVPEPAYRALLARRVAREPVALIVGRQAFWSLEFAVSAATLVPRPDSETLIEAAIAARPNRTGVQRVLDLGTGTGCLLLAALTEFPAAWGLGVDIAPEAAALAVSNARTLGLASRCAFVCGDWGRALQGRFDLVLSNPPYVQSGAIAGLMPEVSRYEPARALDGGADGLEMYRVLVGSLAGLLAPSGLAVLELGDGQSEAVAGLATAAGLGIAVRRDLGGIERALVLERVR